MRSVTQLVAADSGTALLLRFDPCGVNSVQLQETTTGWKIVTMAFTSLTQGCPPHPAPTGVLHLEEN
jgi:hypothetical protein